jgi:tetratricopeptide (TPR) repeat protein
MVKRTLSLILLLWVLVVPTFAATSSDKTIDVDYEYTIVNNESKQDAINSAILQAQRKGMEYVNTFLESDTKTKKNEIVKDNVRVFTAGYIKKTDMLSEPIFYERNGISFVYVKIRMFIGDLVKIPKTQEEINKDNEEKKQANYWFDQGGKAIAEGDYKRGVDCFSRSLDYNVDYAAALFQRGICLEKIGHKSLAKMDFERALKLDPQNFIYKKKVEEMATW